MFACERLRGDAERRMRGFGLAKKIVKLPKSTLVRIAEADERTPLRFNY